MRKKPEIYRDIARLRQRVRTALTAFAVLIVAGAASAEPLRGPVSGQPLPRFASLKAELVYLRQGPGTQYAILFELTRRDLPVEVIGEYDVWRRVRLHDGARGWIHRAMLSTRRMATAVSAAATIRAEPTPAARPVAALGPATPMRLRACGLNWCAVEGHGVAGWLHKSDMWGVHADERFDD